MLGILIGGIGAWFFATDRAQNTLWDVIQAHAEDGSMLVLSLLWFFLVMTGLFLLYVGFVYVIGYQLTKRPVLELLQGTTVKKRKETKRGEESKEGIEGEEAKVGKKPKVGKLLSEEGLKGMYESNMQSDKKTSSSLLRRIGNSGAEIALVLDSELDNSHKLSGFLRMIMKRILCRKGQSTLLFIVAMGFAVILSFMPATIVRNQERVDWLYDNTEVVGTIVRDVMGVRLSVGVPITLARDVLELTDISGKPFVSSYFAATSFDMVIFPTTIPEEELRELTANFAEEPIGRTTMMSFNQIERYESFFGDSLTIEYLDGYDKTLFCQLRDGRHPILVSRWFKEQEEVSKGDYLRVFLIERRMCREANAWVERVMRRYRIYRIVGTFDSINQELGVIVPLGYLQRQRNVPFYYPFEFTLDTAFNREIDTVQEEVRSLISWGGFPYLAIMQDDVLQNVVGPLEQNIVMMGQLYPIVLALSPLIAMGLILLMLLLTVKEVAIMRVMGMTKMRTFIVLFGERVVILIPGLIIGSLASYLFFGYVNLLGIFLYFLSAMLALVVFAIIFLRMRTLGLLQVKE